RGTLGCAFRPSHDYPLFGLCSKFSFFWDSYNTGIVTLCCNGKRSPPRSTQLTFAHELGHSLGAEH
ncbi:hypothetical protein PMAYCL1PPCAC_08545, partial [Pristionchus mayeri]